MSEHQQRFQALLRELFQFDSADLDFGIYRIMNHKREVIERYISEDLPKLIADDLSKGVLAEQARVAEQLAETRKEIRNVLGRYALDSDGMLQAAFLETPVGIRYTSLQRLQARHVAGGSDVGAIQATIFNHLYGFFSRYYEDGDFISKRRYSRRERYAIPYNGEEVHLHWANKDQYYVKTGEHFRHYTFKARSITVRFAVVDADVEQNNVKGAIRYFFPLSEQAEWAEASGTVTIPFEYRPASTAEQATNGKNHLQETLIAQSMQDVPRRLEAAPRAVAALTSEHHRNGDEPVTLLEYHLRRYTRRNTTDFFIHKNLKGFLTRELNFYLKNEVLNIDGVENTDETTAEHWADGWFQIFRLMKIASGQIIDFLDQVESFQKMIWEKRKFVTDVQYLIRLGSIDETFYGAIAACEAQWREWEELHRLSQLSGDLLALDSSTPDGRSRMLANTPMLMLDTRHFSQDFVDALLATFGDLSEATDGTLVHSENTQALHLMGRTHTKAVGCVYVDPPYNTGQDNQFIYKDSYQHSSWMSMVFAAMMATRPWLSRRGGVLVSTDDGEYANLKFVLDDVWGPHNFVADVIWNSRKSVSSDTLISTATNHTTFFAADKVFLDSQKESFRLRQSEANFSNPDADPRGPWTLDPMDAPNVRENLTYVITNPDTGRKFQPPRGRCWRFEKWRTEELLAEGRIVFGRNGNSRPLYKRYFSEAVASGTTPTTLWDDVKTTTDATRMLLNLFGETLPREVVDHIKPKPADLVERCALLLARDDDIVLDFFAGSGTTAHAVINLNRQDGLRRRFTLIEMGEYFDSVMLPRIKKVIFAPSWQEGNPVALATAEETKRAPRIVKYMRLESYEDALDNIEFHDTGVQRAMELEDYVIKYMLRWETKDSSTLLNVEQLVRPFDYKLSTHANGNGGTERADVAETFNYLLGLQVRTRKVHYDDERKYLVYRGTAEGEDVVVIWRETEGWKPEDYRRDQRFVDAQNIAEEADRIYANGVTFVKGAKALEPIFKERMFAPLN